MYVFIWMPVSHVTNDIMFESTHYARSPTITWMKWLSSAACLSASCTTGSARTQYGHQLLPLSSCPPLKNTCTGSPVVDSISVSLRNSSYPWAVCSWTIVDVVVDIPASLLKRKRCKFDLSNVAKRCLRSMRIYVSVCVCGVCEANNYLSELLLWALFFVLILCLRARYR